MRREAFLSAVSRASMASRLPQARTMSDELPDYHTDDLVTLFRVNAQAVNAVVHGPVSRHGVPRSVLAIAGGHRVKTFMSWDDLPAAGVNASLVAEGYRRVDHGVPDDRRTEHNLSYADLDMGVTGADAGLAESGSVVLLHGPGRPRMASLIPEIHVAILDVELLAMTLAHWSAVNPDVLAGTSNLAIVTGPSRTGDIEQQLNLGVHGPRHVHIVLSK